MNPEGSWPAPPRFPPLEDAEVHVWQVYLDRPPPSVEKLAGVLSGDERDKAGRFHFERDRRRYTCGRGVLRTLLGNYLSSAPESIVFAYNRYGKPELDGPHRAQRLNFSVSHSHARALIAFTRGREVGIDIEYIRPDFEGELIATRYFSASEVAALRTLPAASRGQAFFNCWTRKEAFIKAVGHGLSLSLQSFDVSLLPGEPAALLNTRFSPREVTRWSLRDLQPGPGFAAAIAVAGPAWQIKCWQWPDSA